MTVQQLQELGFKQGSAIVYTALLELGMARASEVSRQAKMARDLTYFYLDNLVENGYAKETQKHRVAHYVPENPEVIIQKIEEEEKKLQEKKILAKKLCKEHLTPIYEKDKNFRVYQIDGEKGMEKIRQYMLKTGERIRNVFSFDEMRKNFPMQKNDTRLAFKTHKRGIESITTTEKHHGIQKDGSITRYFLPQEVYDIKGELVIYGDKIILTHSNEKSKFVVIEDKDSAKILKMLFDLALCEIKRRIKNNELQAKNTKYDAKW